MVASARLDGAPELARRLDVRAARSDGCAPALIAQAWLRWREACPEHLRGDFAFAVWDPRRRQMFCARDIMGVRPLYVHHRPGVLFAFASRAQALLRIPGVESGLNEGRIADALVPQLESIDKRCTFYQSIQRLPPAHSTSIRTGAVHERTFWQLEPGRVSLPNGDAQWSEALRHTLEQAVSHHLQGDLHVGCMLSGGMDSSSLAAIAARQLRATCRPPLPTFSSVSADSDCLETQAVQAMLKLPGFEPTIIDPALVDAQHQELVDATWRADEPFDCTMLLLHAQYHNASLAGMDAVIDGIDGDMLFARGNALVRQLRSLAWLQAWRNLRGFGALYPDYRIHQDLPGLMRAAFVPQRIRRSLRRIRASDGYSGLIKTSLIDADFARHVNLSERLLRAAQWLPPGVERHAPLQARHALMHPNTTCGLERYHRVAAYHGITPRHPFADRDVLELCVNLPDRQRLTDGYSKAVLRRAMRQLLPAEVCWRSDKTHLGWSLIEKHLLGSPGDVQGQLHALLPSLEPYVNRAAAAKAVHCYRQPGQHWAGVALLSVFALGKWLQSHKAGGCS